MGTRAKVYLTFFIAAGSMVTAWAAVAQSYPTKPIRIIVPAAPGGAPDIAARNLANELGLQLGQQMVVDNRPGANGIIGYEMLARAAPDGYTLGNIVFGFATNPSLVSKLPYDSARDFQPLILFGSTPQVLAVTPSLPIRSVKELIEYARARPGVLSFGISGIGGSQHLAMELLKSMTNTNMVHVSYKGPQQAINDVIGGQIQLVFVTVSSILPQVRSGRVRAVAVGTLKRSPVVPEVPTLDEAGIPGFEMTPWAGYALPARAPRDLVLRLNAEINKALMLPSMLKSIAERGSTPIGGTPEQFADHLRKEIDKWAKVITSAGIKPQ